MSVSKVETSVTCCVSSKNPEFARRVCYSSPPMRRQDFQFELPAELIAQYPAPERTASRLLVMDSRTGALQDRQFEDLQDLLSPGDLLVMNDTRVIPARLFGNKASGGKIEVLVERILDEHTFLAQVRASKSPGPGTKLHLQNNIKVDVLDREGDLFRLFCAGDTPVVKLLEQHGHMPLPPYIDRADNERDQDRYQTVYARHAGAVAAPTAGLHFDQALLDKLRALGIEQTWVTLHVGAGTFQPVRVDEIREHTMHSEWIDVSDTVCEQVAATRARGGKVIAVGTTSVRCLETAARSGSLRPFTGETDIFIYPGYEFKVVDALLTNFHLPESTLLMLVCAFGGYEHTLAAYRHAVSKCYRFFSYGDAMLINTGTRY